MTIFIWIVVFAGAITLGIARGATKSILVRKTFFTVLVLVFFFEAFAIGGYLHPPGPPDRFTLTPVPTITVKVVP